LSLDSIPAGWDSKIHKEPQDTEGEAWQLLLDAVDRAAADGRLTVEPRGELLPQGFWPEIVRLPSTLGGLKEVRELKLYGSHLIAIPPEIGEMTSLTSFDPYTSGRLHWFPYEITRCRNLHYSRVSTRHLYGNYKNRLPFPSLPTELPAGSVPSRCSVCDGKFDGGSPIQRWISLWVAADVLPLLVHACSQGCVNALPDPPEGYVDHPHVGGPELPQPGEYHGVWRRVLRPVDAGASGRGQRALT
jgi:hypothetical protein